MSNVVFRNEQKSSTSTGGKCLIGVMYEENFGALLPFIRDVEVTDINWNGKELWIDDVSRGRYCSGIKLDKDFIDAFCVRVANVVSKTFNKYYPKLEAETDELRITIVHHSRSHTGTIISIRKTPIVKRITFAKSIKEDYYCPEEIANFLSNSVKAKFNIVIGGLPGVGKTELIKYLTNYIFPRDRVITIEDTMEIHYSQINPHKDCVELKVDDNILTYTDAIKICLRLLPQWIILSEARSKEVQYLLESISTGAKCITTIHTDDMRKVPKRVVNMMGDMDNSSLAESMAYTYFDIGILVDKVQDTQTGKISRFIAQIVMYYEENGENKCVVLYNRGLFTGADIPDEALKQFNRMGIADPWKYTFIQDTQQDIDDSTGFLDEGSDDGMSVLDDTTGLKGTSTSRYMDEEDEVSGDVDIIESSSETINTSVDSLDMSEGCDNNEGIEATDFVEDKTGFMEDLSSDEDEPTSFIEEKVVISEEDDNEKPTDFIDNVDFDSERPTGFVDASSLEEDDAPTGYIGEVVDDSESATDFINIKGTEGNEGSSSKKSTNRKGRRKGCK